MCLEDAAIASLLVPTVTGVTITTTETEVLAPDPLRYALLVDVYPGTLNTSSVIAWLSFTHGGVEKSINYFSQDIFTRLFRYDQLGEVIQGGVNMDISSSTAGCSITSFAAPRALFDQIQRHAAWITEVRNG